MMEYVQRELPYVRSYVLRSVYGMLRQEGFGTELTISLRRPCDGMSKQKVARSMQEMLDQIVRHLEHILMTEGTDDAKAK